jgi:acetyl-CoA carboxylase carboxyl transferase subunit beta
MAETENEPLKLQKEGIPEGLWMRCPECGDMLFRKVVEEALHVCPGCQHHHFRVSARTRIAQLVLDERKLRGAPRRPGAGRSR